MQNFQPSEMHTEKLRFKVSFYIFVDISNQQCCYLCCLCPKVFNFGIPTGSREAIFSRIYIVESPSGWMVVIINGSSIVQSSNDWGRAGIIDWLKFHKSSSMKQIYKALPAVTQSMSTFDIVVMPLCVIVAFTISFDEVETPNLQSAISGSTTARLMLITFVTPTEFSKRASRTLLNLA